MSERELPPRVDLDDIYDIYHCDSCHEDLEYGFTEAIENVVVVLPDGSLGTYGDSCCAVLRSLDRLDVAHIDAWSYQNGDDPKKRHHE
jgi:hypothetical protein